TPGGRARVMAATEKQWYASIRGTRIGPLTFDALNRMAEAGQLSQTDLIWSTGQTQWVAASTVEGLGFSTEVPPPLPANQVALPRFTVADGIIFCETEFLHAVAVQQVQQVIHGFFSQAQLKNLGDVKAALAKNARMLDCNCVMHFTYGQKSGCLTWFLGLDDVSWYGAGIASRVPDAIYQAATRRM